MIWYRYWKISITKPGNILKITRKNLTDHLKQMKGCKICGISDPKTLTYIVDHPHPPQFVGFIVNWKASSRYVELDRLKELLNIDKKKSKYVAVVVKNDESTLEKIKDLPFDYYQMYDCSPEEIIKIKEKYNKKIIAALTIENKEDIKKYKEYERYI